MDWKGQLKICQKDKDWDAGLRILLLQIEYETANPDVYLILMYYLMNILVEEDYTPEQAECYEHLLKKAFEESYLPNQNDAEYLCYTGFIALMSEWYVGLEASDANTMIINAHNMDPGNKLYSWVYHSFVTRGFQASVYAESVLLDPSAVEKITAKGILGEYMLELMKYSC